MEIFSAGTELHRSQVQLQEVIRATTAAAATGRPIKRQNDTRSQLLGPRQLKYVQNLAVEFESTFTQVYKHTLNISAMVPVGTIQSNRCNVSSTNTLRQLSKLSSRPWHRFPFSLSPPRWSSCSESDSGW